MSVPFTMPITDTAYSITWTPTEADRTQAKANHNGSDLERIRDHGGGISMPEMAALLRHREPLRMSFDDAFRDVQQVLIMRAAHASAAVGGEG